MESRDDLLIGRTISVSWQSRGLPLENQSYHHVAGIGSIAIASILFHRFSKKSFSLELGNPNG
jgi:hypothetical protein